MADFIYLMAIVAFFALAAAFVKACDLIIGPDDAALTERGSGVAEAPAEGERAA